MVLHLRGLPQLLAVPSPPIAGCVVLRPLFLSVVELTSGFQVDFGLWGDVGCGFGLGIGHRVAVRSPVSLPPLPRALSLWHRVGEGFGVWGWEDFEWVRERWGSGSGKNEGPLSLITFFSFFLVVVFILSPYKLMIFILIKYKPT